MCGTLALIALIVSLSYNCFDAVLQHMGTAGLMFQHNNREVLLIIVTIFSI